jgi:D-lactate dehydrogenase (cytochrome)
MNDLSSYLEDAAHFPGGHADGIDFPRTVEEVADAVRGAARVLPIGAQSSLTGGATPMGERLLSTARLDRVIGYAGGSPGHLVTVEAGVTIDAMQAFLAQHGAWFPPAPTFTGATAGGIVATNAAGAATFKYGSTRESVERLTVVLADGSILRLSRGEHLATGGVLRLGRTDIPVPRYTVPPVAKKSAGYFTAPQMDAVDLFIGSEGTLGIVTEITFRVLSPVPAQAFALVPCRSEEQAFRLAANLREASVRTWQQRDPDGIDAAAIEHIDRRSIDILVDDGVAAREQVTFPDGTNVVLFVHLELPAGTTAEAAYRQIASAHEARDGALVRFCRLVEGEDLLDVTELAMPGDRRRTAQFLAVREGVPSGVNARVGIAKSTIDSRIAKTAADMIVPFDRFPEMNASYRRGFESRRLDYAIWGHLSDGNVHPNVIPQSYDDVLKGREAILEFGREVARLGGCPLAEHGVGRNAVKQELLRQLYGEAGIEQMRAVKRALDPEWKLAPGVIFSP